MTTKEMEDLLVSLKKERAKLDDRIKQLEKEIASKKSNPFPNVRMDKNNKKLFGYYMKESRNRDDKTFRRYCKTLEDMRMMIENHYSVSLDFEFVYVDDPIVFQKLIQMFENVSDLVAENRRRHHDISAAYNNYYNFLLIKRA